MVCCIYIKYQSKHQFLQILYKPSNCKVNGTIFSYKEAVRLASIQKYSMLHDYIKFPHIKSDFKVLVTGFYFP